MTKHAMYCPSRSESFAATGSPGAAGVTLRAASGRQLRLGPLEARLWQLCDGNHDVACIARILGDELATPVSGEAVWRALDGLADAGLLTNRLAPPASPARVDRRGFLRRTWPGLALAGSAVVPGVALAQAAASTAEEDQKASLEVQNKQQESTQKARAQEENNKRRAALRRSTEQNQKVSEQSAKVQAEQSRKADQAASRLAEQSNKSSERDAKVGLEQSRKQSVANEHENKASLEQSAKASDEQDSKTVAFEESSKKFSREQAEKIERAFDNQVLVSQSLIASESQTKDLEQSAKNTVFDQFLFTSEQDAKAFLTDAQLDAIPEPASLALFGAALAALAAARYAGKSPDAEPGENAASGK